MFFSHSLHRPTLHFPLSPAIPLFISIVQLINRKNSYLLCNSDASRLSPATATYCSCSVGVSRSARSARSATAARSAATRSRGRQSAQREAAVRSSGSGSGGGARHRPAPAAAPFRAGPTPTPRRSRRHPGGARGRHAGSARSAGGQWARATSFSATRPGRALSESSLGTGENTRSCGWFV